MRQFHSSPKEGHGSLIASARLARPELSVTIRTCAHAVVVRRAGLSLGAVRWLCHPASDSVVLSANLPLHLEDYLDVAIIEGSEIPTDVPEPMEWRFDEPQPVWKPAYGYEFSQELVTPVRTSDALRVILEEKHVDSDGDICGYVYTDLPDWQLQDWAYVVLEARAQPGMGLVRLQFNLTEPARAGVRQARGLPSPLIADGTVQTYLLSPDPIGGEFDGIWRRLLLQFCAQPSTIDLVLCENGLARNRVRVGGLRAPTMRE